MSDFPAEKPDTEKTPTADGATPPGIHDDRHREAYRLRRRGEKVADIAGRFGVDVRTVYRWIQTYHDTYRRTIEETPVVNLIAEEVAKLEEVEQTPLQSSDTCSHDAQRRAYLNLALKAIQARQHLLLEVGVLPREPTKIYSAVQEMKPPSPEAAKHTGDSRTDDEIRTDIIKLLRQSRTL